MEKNKEYVNKISVRVLCVCAAVSLIIYVAKIWFVDPVSLNGNNKQHEQKSLNKKQLISWRDAGNYYGQYAVVEGRVVSTHNTGKVCFLNFDFDYKKNFSAVIFASAFSFFPSHPEDYYKNKKVRIAGYVKEYNGKPEIILNNLNQIEVVK